MPFSDGRDKFLGMTKATFTRVLVGMLLVSFALNAHSLREEATLARQGAQAHAAICVLRGDYAQREQQTAAYLKLTHEQRVRRYGTAIADIPDSTLRQSLTNLRSNVNALADLHCGG